MRRKPTNVSREKRLRRPPKPVFALTGIVIGTFVGEGVALLIEVVIAQPSRWIMLAGGVVGGLLGLLAETGRYCWRKHKYRSVENAWRRCPRICEHAA